MIQPINDYVLIKPYKEDTGGIVEAETLEGMPEVGIVEATDSDVVKIGDKVFFDRFLATEVKDKGEKFFLVLFSDIKAIINEQ